MSEHIIDLECYVNRYGEESLIDCLHEHACELGIDQLVLAIEQLWRSQAGQLTIDKCSEAKEQSLGEQDRND
jgi:hypothetical protein